MQIIEEYVFEATCILSMCTLARASLWIFSIIPTFFSLISIFLIQNLSASNYAKCSTESNVFSKSIMNYTNRDIIYFFGFLDSFGSSCKCELWLKVRLSNGQNKSSV